MSDGTKGSGLTEDMKPANQTGEDKGVIKSQQRVGNDSRIPDTARGAEPEMRGTSGNRG